MPSLYFFRPREWNHVKHVFLDKYFTSITVQRRSWSHTNARFLRKSYIPLFFFHIAFQNSSFVPINKKQTNKQGTLHSLVWKVTIFNTHRPGWFAFVAMISQICNIQAKTSRIPCLNFGKSRFKGSLKIPFPVKTFSVFPNSALYFCQIPNPEKQLQASRLCWILTSANWASYGAEGRNWRLE